MKDYDVPRRRRASAEFRVMAANLMHGAGFVNVLLHEFNRRRSLARQLRGVPGTPATCRRRLQRGRLAAVEGALAAAMQRHVPWALVLLLAALARAPFCPNEAIASPRARRMLLAHHMALHKLDDQFAPPGAEPVLAKNVEDAAPRRSVRSLWRPAAWGARTLPKFEDDDWPKPLHCSARVRKLERVPCRSHAGYLADAEHAVVAHLVLKAGSTALRTFWKCAFPGEERRYGPLDWGPRRAARAVHVALARDPLERLLSGYSELLLRSTRAVRSMPSGRIFRLPSTVHMRQMLASFVDSDARIASALRMAGVGGEAGALADELRRTQAGWLVAGYSGGRADWPPPAAVTGKGRFANVRGQLDEAARFRAFLRSLECAGRYNRVGHVESVSALLGVSPLSELNERLFAASARRRPWCEPIDTEPPPITMIMRQETLAADLARMLERVNATARVRARGCQLPQSRISNVAPKFEQSDKLRGSAIRIAQRRERINATTGVPSRATLRAILDADPVLMQVVCRVYVQDYACLGYPLPESCLRPLPGAPLGLFPAAQGASRVVEFERVPRPPPEGKGANRLHALRQKAMVWAGSRATTVSEAGGGGGAAARKKPRLITVRSVSSASASPTGRPVAWPGSSPGRRGASQKQTTRLKRTAAD